MAQKITALQGALNPRRIIVLTEGEKHFLIRVGRVESLRPERLEDLDETQLAMLAQALSDALDTVSAYRAWRGQPPTDAELCTMADYYADLDRGCYEMACDALDRCEVAA
jgi:hypothetical protein